MIVARGPAAPLAFALALASILCLLSTDAGPTPSRSAARARSPMARRNAPPPAAAPAPADPRALRSDPFRPIRASWGLSDLSAVEEDDSSDGDSFDLLATAGIAAIPDRSPAAIGRASLRSSGLIPPSRRSIVLRC